MDHFFFFERGRLRLSFSSFFFRNRGGWRKWKSFSSLHPKPGKDHLSWMTWLLFREKRRQVIFFLFAGRPRRKKTLLFAVLPLAEFLSPPSRRTFFLVYSYGNASCPLLLPCLGGVPHGVFWRKDGMRPSFFFPLSDPTGEYEVLVFPSLSPPSFGAPPQKVRAKSAEGVLSEAPFSRFPGPPLLRVQLYTAAASLPSLFFPVGGGEIVVACGGIEGGDAILPPPFLFYARSRGRDGRTRFSFSFLFLFLRFAIGALLGN